MSASLPKPSSRLLRAAAAEQADLTRHRERLTRERVRLLGELRQLDAALAAADRRLEVLTELVGPPEVLATPEPATPGATAVAAGATAATPHADTTATGHEDNRPLLRGPAIREAAVRVLISQPEHVDALHYRRWYELLVAAGYRVAGKDPLAVFLTQLSRSPVVRKASTAGVYELDRQAPLRIRQRLERLQAELREVTVATDGPIELGIIRARRHELDLAISQQERALEEALRVLRAVGSAGVAMGAAHAG
jgi:hypothetical protein